MNATTILGWASRDEGTIYCDDCFTGDRKDAHPVFAGEDAIGTICDECGEYLLEPEGPSSSELEAFTCGAWHAALFTFGAWSDNHNAPAVYTQGDDPEIPDNAWGRELHKDCAGFLTPEVCGMLRAEGDDFYHAGGDFHYSRNEHGCGFLDSDRPTYRHTLHKLAEVYGDNELTWDDVLPEPAERGSDAPAWQIEVIEAYAARDWRAFVVTLEWDPDSEWIQHECDDAGDGFTCEAPDEWDARERARREPWIAYMSMPGCLDVAGHSRGATQSEALHALLEYLGTDNAPREITEESYRAWFRERGWFAGDSLTWDAGDGYPGGSGVATMAGNRDCDEVYTVDANGEEIEIHGFSVTGVQGA